MIDIRDERAEDLSAIRDVNNRAFGKTQEANIIDALRSNAGVLLSLVATLHGEVVGHILYSPASINDVVGAALGLMAVVPRHQREGIGSRLVETGNQRIQDAGWPFIIVLGHADFYPRFGFKAANARGVTCIWDVPDDVCMLRVLDEQRMQGVTGLAKYRDEFSTT